MIETQLTAAESLCRRGEHGEAAAICSSLLESESPRIRAAAFRGLVAARPAETADLILAAFSGHDAGQLAVAADLVVDLREPAQFQKIVEAIPSLPDESRAALFLALAGRSDSGVRPAARNALDDRNLVVVAAALRALMRSGTADDVPALLALIATGAESAVRDAAFETLRWMPADGVDRAIGAWFEQTADPPSIIVKLALARRSPELVPAFLKAIQSASAETRVEAWKALEVMADGQCADALVQRLCETEFGEEREAADRAVWMSCQRIGDPAKRSAPLLAVLERGDQAASVAVLPTLARIGDERALPAVRKAMQSDDVLVRDAGHRALVNWPDPAVADELLLIVKTSRVEAYRMWSLRAYARLIALPSDRPAQQTFELLRDAMSLAARPEDRELFLARLAAVRVPAALDLLLSCLDDPALRKAAVPAVFTLAKGLSQSHPEPAAAALMRIQPLVDDPAIAQQIHKVLRDIENRK
jgi:HEAT repeat protein